MNIEYYFLKRSALQFRQDLIEINESLDLLTLEESLAIISYIDSIKVKMKIAEEKLVEKLSRYEK